MTVLLKTMLTSWIYPNLGCVDSSACTGLNVVCIDGQCGPLPCSVDSDCTQLGGEIRIALCDPDGGCACTPNCEGMCSEQEYCCAQTNRCESLSAGCETTCPDGYERRLEGIRADRFICQIQQETCECTELAPLDEGLIGRFASMTANDTQFFVSAYAEDYGDLVVGVGDLGGDTTWHWVDGLPQGVRRWSLVQVVLEGALKNRDPMWVSTRRSRWTAMAASMLPIMPWSWCSPPCVWAEGR